MKQLVGSEKSPLCVGHMNGMLELGFVVVTGVEKIGFFVIGVMTIGFFVDACTVATGFDVIVGAVGVV